MRRLWMELDGRGGELEGRRGERRQRRVRERSGEDESSVVMGGEMVFRAREMERGREERGGRGERHAKETGVEEDMCGDGGT